MTPRIKLTLKAFVDGFVCEGLQEGVLVCKSESAELIQRWSDDGRLWPFQLVYKKYNAAADLVYFDVRLGPTGWGETTA